MRALRRWNQMKKRKRRERIYRYWNHKDPDPQISKVFKKTFTTCSCPMCGNPRRHFGQETRQELAVRIKEKEGLCESTFLLQTDS